MDPGSVLVVAVVAVVGSLLGATCALVPGFHSNTLALVLLSLLGPLSSALSALASLPGAALSGTMLFAVLLVAAATSHSFADFVPSVFLGVPDEDTVLSMLPAHRLLKAGKGMDAVRHAATGSLCGAMLAIALAAPLLLLLSPPSMIAVALDASVPYLLVGVLVLLVLTERGHEAPTARLDARKGRFLPPGQVTICHPIPVQGKEGTLSGQVARRGPRSFKLSTSQGDWKVVSGPNRPGSGFVTVQGTWIVERRAMGSRLAALSLIMLSGLLGFAVMNSSPPLAGIFEGLGQSLLFPLLSGLFAFPALLSAASSGPIPAQDKKSERSPTLIPALPGTFAGFLAGWMPGITSTIGTVIGSCLTPRPRDREQGTKSYILMLSAVGTSSVVFSLLALCVRGSGRTGAMLALKQALGRDGLAALPSFPSAPASLLLVAALVASAIGYCFTLWAGGLASRGIAGRDLGKLNLVVLVGLSALILVFNGLQGLEVAGIAALIGELPARLGVRRVHLTGCLLVPLMIFYLGLESTLIGLIW